MNFFVWIKIAFDKNDNSCIISFTKKAVDWVNRSMKPIKLQLLLLLILFNGQVAAQPDSKLSELKFVIYYPQVPPYLYQDKKTDQVVGIVPEVVQDFFQQQNIKVQFVADNRTRAEHRIYQGDVDAILLAKQWTRSPEKLIFSDALLQHTDYLFSRRPIEIKGELADSLAGKTVCTRQNYVYHAIEPLFKLKKLIRVDASSELTQLKMLLNSRCDYAMMNEHVASWLLSHHFSDQQLYRSAQGFNSVALTVAFHPRWKVVLPAFNQYLQQQKQQETIQQWIKFYVNKP